MQRSQAFWRRRVGGQTRHWVLNDLVLAHSAIVDDVGDYAMPEHSTLSSEDLTSCAGLTLSFYDALRLYGDTSVISVGLHYFD